MCFFTQSCFCVYAGLWTCMRTCIQPPDVGDSALRRQHAGKRLTMSLHLSSSPTFGAARTLRLHPSPPTRLGSVANDTSIRVHEIDCRKDHQGYSSTGDATWRLLCVFLMTYLLIRDYNIVPKKEVYGSLQVVPAVSNMCDLQCA